MNNNNVKQRLTRHQQRAKERFEDEAKSVFNNIAERFLKIFISSEFPDSATIEIKRQQYDAQWRIYCKRMQLVPEAYKAFNEYSAGILREYQEKTKKPEAPKPIKHWYQFWK